MTRPGPKTNTPAGETLVKKNFTLDEMTLRKLAVLGNGNLSAGVREAARVAYDLYQKGKL
jgi:hypothetical protein